MADSGTRNVGKTSPTDRLAALGERVPETHGAENTVRIFLAPDHHGDARFRRRIKVWIAHDALLPVSASKAAHSLSSLRSIHPPDGAEPPPIQYIDFGNTNFGISHVQRPDPSGWSLPLAVFFHRAKRQVMHGLVIESLLMPDGGVAKSLKKAWDGLCRRAQKSAQTEPKYAKFAARRAWNNIDNLRQKVYDYQSLHGISSIRKLHGNHLIYCRSP